MMGGADTNHSSISRFGSDLEKKYFATRSLSYLAITVLGFTVMTVVDMV